MARDGDIWRGAVSGVGAGQRYGYRVEGEWAPERGLWFDPAKLLVDPHADGHRPALRLAPGAQPVRRRYDDPGALGRRRGTARGCGARAAGLRARWPDLRDQMCGASRCCTPTYRRRSAAAAGALAHPTIVAHLKKIGVSAVELMPIVAWIDERHFAAAGAQQCLGLQSGRAHAARPAPLPRGHGGVARDGARRCTRQGSASSSISSSITPARATCRDLSCRSAASTMRP